MLLVTITMLLVTMLLVTTLPVTTLPVTTLLFAEDKHSPPLHSPLHFPLTNTHTRACSQHAYQLATS